MNLTVQKTFNPIQYTRWCAWFGALVGLFVTMGWFMDVTVLKNFHPSFSFMKVNTSISFFFLSLGLYINTLDWTQQKKKTVSFLFVAIPAIFGSLTLLQYIFALDFKIDELFMQEPLAPLFPGRMAVSTAVNFVLLSASLVLSNLENLKAQRTADSLAVFAAMIVFPNLVSFAWGIDRQFNLYNSTPIAFHTVVTFTILALGQLLNNYKNGIVSQLLSNNIGAIAMRHFLPKATLAFYVMGWLVIVGSRAEVFDTNFAIALVVIGSILICTYLLFANAKRLNITETERLSLEQQMHRAQFELQSIETEKRNESAMRDLMDRLNAALSSAKMAVWDKDLTTGKTWYSANHHEIYGYLNSNNSVVEKELQAQIIPADQQRVQESYKLALKRGFSALQFQILREDGSTAWIEQHLKTVYDEQHTPSNIIGIVIDISDRKASDQALYKAMQDISLYKTALDQTAIVSFANTQGAITFANDHFCELSGFNRDELLGQNYRFLNSGYHSRDFFKNLWTTITGGQIWRGEICNRTKSGGIFWVDACIVPILDIMGEITGYFSVRFDITERKLAEQKLIQSAKMSSLGEMASGIAHEINTPLAVIHGKAALLNLQLEMNKFDKLIFASELEKITQTTDRIAKIIRGLKTFSRSSKQDPMILTPIKQIIDDTLELCKEKFAHNGIPLKVDIQTQTKLECRPSEISQVLLNLLNNSMDAILPLAHKWVELKVYEDGTKLKLQVTDSGSGIPPEIVNSMMQPFFTTKEIGKGTGLGLSISNGIAEGHKGSIAYDSTCKNTRFVLTIPIYQTSNMERQSA